MTIRIGQPLSLIRLCSACKGASTSSSSRQTQMTNVMTRLLLGQLNVLNKAARAGCFHLHQRSKLQWQLSTHLRRRRHGRRWQQRQHSGSIRFQAGLRLSSWRWSRTLGDRKPPSSGCTWRRNLAFRQSWRKGQGMATTYVLALLINGGFRTARW